MDPVQLTIDPCYSITPTKFHILKNAHIPMADGPPTSLKLTIDLCYTFTPMKFHIEKNAHKPMADGLQILPQIDHRSTLYHYTQ